MAENEKQSEPVDVDFSKATPLEPAEPVEMPSIMGATFAERRAAREGKQVKADEGDVEDKAVKRSESKRAAKKA